MLSISYEIFHHYVIKWKHFPRCWSFVKGIHRSPVDSTHKGKWRGALAFSMRCAWTNDWANRRDVVDLRRYCIHCDGRHQAITWTHYVDVIMTTMAYQITSLTVVYSTVYSDADQRKHQSSASLAFVWGIHRDRWIPRTKGQLCGKCFHLMTSLWILLDDASGRHYATMS